MAPVFCSITLPQYQSLTIDALAKMNQMAISHHYC